MKKNIEPKITVIVPIYNVEKYISRCLESLINQTFKDFEVLAIDDGSPDNSDKIVERYSNKDGRIKLIVKENGGYGSVLEYALKNINTKYFLICDPDDWLKNTTLEELYNFAEKDRLDIAMGDIFKVYNDNGKRIYYKTFRDSLGIAPNRVYANEDKKRFVLGNVSPHAKLFKTDIAKKIRFPHKVGYTDNILYLFTLLNAEKVAYLNKPLAFYLIDRPGNTMTAKVESQISGMIVIWNSIYEQFIKNYDIKNHTEVFYFLYLILKRILRLEAQLSNFFEKKNVFKIMIKMKKYKNELSPYIYNQFLNLKSNDTNIIFNKIFFRGFMSDKLWKETINIFILLEKRKKSSSILS